MEILTAARLLARGHDLPPVTKKRAKPVGGGYRMNDLLTSATSEVLDTFRGQLHAVVSDDFARVFCSANPRTGNPCAGNQLIFEDGTAWRPFINRESATDERPCWSDLVRSIWPVRRGEQCLILVVDDFKKRLWPYARAGVLGSQTPVFLHDYTWHGVETVETVDWPRLLACLDLVEDIYTLGWPKTAIRDSLISHLPLVQELGATRVMELEHGLAAWRGRAEFRVALMIAQRRVS